MGVSTSQLGSVGINLSENREYNYNYRSQEQTRLTLRRVAAAAAVVVVAVGAGVGAGAAASVRGFLLSGSSLAGSSALFFRPTTSAGGFDTILSTSARSTKSGGLSHTEVLKFTFTVITNSSTILLLTNSTKQHHYPYQQIINIYPITHLY